MELVLSEDQEFIARTAQEFAAEKSPVSRFRALRDSGDETGFSREVWKEMADLGWTGILFPESVGGADLGMAEMAVVLEALGRTLAPEPFLSSVLLGGQAVLRAVPMPRRASGCRASWPESGCSPSRPRSRTVAGTSAASRPARARMATASC